MLVSQLCIAAPVTDQKILDNLQNVSVTISVDGRGRGSGTLFTREVKPGTFKSYVWTAGHVVDDLRTERSVIDKKTGTKKIIVGFKDCQIYQETIQDGRKVKQEYLDCKVICYSNSDTGDDQAVLEVRMRNYTRESTTFYLGDEIPGIGTELIHVGSLLGDIGSCSFTTGVTSQIGRLLALNDSYAEAVYDQTSAVSFPGSSGGGVFNQETGQYVGMLTAGIRDAQGFAWYVPVRRQLEWARGVNMVWAMDATVPMPSAEDLKEIPLDDGR
jgi:S1-C subfamily serine protease